MYIEQMSVYPNSQDLRVVVRMGDDFNTEFRMWFTYRNGELTPTDRDMIAENVIVDSTNSGEQFALVIDGKETEQYIDLKYLILCRMAEAYLTHVQKEKEAQEQADLDHSTFATVSSSDADEIRENFNL